MKERSSAGPDAATSARHTPPKKPVRPALRSSADRAKAPSPSLEPTILLVGADSTFEPALRAALLRHRVYVETTTPDAAAGAVIATAPDLVLLVGAAARDGGSHVLDALLSSPTCSVVPVVLLDDNTALDMRLRAFRHGAAAVIPPSASIDAIAEQVAKLAREIPERGGEALGVVGEATLSEFVGTLSRELRSGILSVRAGGTDDEAVRLVLGSGRPLAAFIDDFVKQVKAHVLHAEPLHYEFAEHASGTIALLDPHAAGPLAGLEPLAVKGVRVALADDDTGRADTVAQELRARGVSVVVTDLAPTELRFAKLRQLDPEILLIGEAQVKGPGFELLRRMRRDTRLRWTSLLVVRWDEIWSEALSVPALDQLEIALAALSEADRTLQHRGESGEAFDARLEVTGPARCLRALTTSHRPLRLNINNARVTLSIDLSDGLVVGASGQSRLDPNQHWEGALALSAFLVLSSGRIHVAPVTQPSATNVMATIDVALNMADSEPSPIAPSVPVVAPPEQLEAPASAAARRLSPLAAVSTRVARSLFGQARIGISPEAALFVIALAALQGLLVVCVLSLLFKAQPRARAGGSASALAPAAASVAPSPVAAAPPAAAAVPGSAAPQPLPASSAATADAGAPATAPTEQLRDESGRSAPTCEGLLGGAAVHGGESPEAAYAEMQNANHALVQGDLDASQRALCKAALWNHTNSAIPLQLAQLMLLRRDGVMAIAWAKKSLALQPGNQRGLGILGDGLARVGDAEGAKRAWLASLRVPSSSDEQYRALSVSSEREAEASLNRRDYARAERFFRRAVVLNPENLSASNGLSDALLKLGDTPSALLWANHSVAVAPRDAATRVVLGEALFQHGDPVAAETEWREALHFDPNNYLAKLRLSRASRAR